MPHFALVTTDGDALGTVELGRPDWPDGAIIYRAEKPNLSTDDLPLDKGVTDSVNELFDWLLVVSRRYLACALRVFGDHYDTHRPHRSPQLTPPATSSRELQDRRLQHSPRNGATRRGGLIHEYSHAA